MAHSQDVWDRLSAGARLPDCAEAAQPGARRGRARVCRAHGDESVRQNGTSSFFIRRHTPFSPYVAPRFPHMSEIDFSFFVSLGRAAREGAREGLRRSWARGSAQGVERRKSAAVHGWRATQIRRGMQSISPYTQNNGGRTVSYICSRARRERNVYSQSSLEGRCRRLGNEHDST